MLSARHSGRMLVARQRHSIEVTWSPAHCCTRGIAYEKHKVSRTPSSAARAGRRAAAPLPDCGLAAGPACPHGAATAPGQAATQRAKSHAKKPDARGSGLCSL